MRRFSWRWIGLSLTVIGLGAAFLAIPLRSFPAEPVGQVLVWTGLALFISTLLAPVVGWFRRQRMYRLLDRWRDAGSKPDEYPEQIRRHIYGNADAVLPPQWEVSRDGFRMRLRNTGVDGSVDVTNVTAIGPVEIDLDLDLSLPAAIPQGASFAFEFTDRVAGFGPYCGALVEWSRPSGGGAREVFYL